MKVKPSFFLLSGGKTGKKYDLDKTNNCRLPYLHLTAIIDFITSVMALFLLDLIAQAQIGFLQANSHSQSLSGSFAPSMSKASLGKLVL